MMMMDDGGDALKKTPAPRFCCVAILLRALDARGGRARPHALARSGSHSPVPGEVHESHVRGQGEGRPQDGVVALVLPHRALWRAHVGFR